MKVQSVRPTNIGKEIGTKVGFLRANTLEEARENIWEQFKSESTCQLDVWETNGKSESFIVYYNK
jgi:hypothetical protein